MTGKDLRIVFMGTPDFAVASLSALLENGYQVVGVVTAPDKPAGRGQKMQQSAVKTFALARQLPVLQPEKLKDETFIADLKSLCADLQIVVAFRMLPEVVWKMPPMGTFNLHGSLLPRYRGAAPLNWAIMNGDTESGVTTFLLKQEIDTGNILFFEKVKISADQTVGELHDQLMGIGAKLVLKTVDTLAEGSATPISQDKLEIDPDRLHAPKIFKEDCRVDWQLDAQFNHNKIRGLSPYPTAWTELSAPSKENIILKIFRASLEKCSHRNSPGTILSDQKKYAKIACAHGYLSITDLQLAGKKRMGIEEFLRGFPGIESYNAV
ncbi:MAG: methionyl-tRNA formyltransferase [Prolixibacteraceae bacterium]|jgi:methionyl-tRNA formyltransferase|nr:methionyl-tRNA formyltransferase [Prolixibacteraceae bacterium]